MSDYLKKHMASGLEIGDRVRVTRAAESTEAGWANTWVSDMDLFIGKIGVIEKDNAVLGFRVVAMNDYWNFPYFVLEKVED